MNAIDRWVKLNKLKLRRNKLTLRKAGKTISPGAEMLEEHFLKVSEINIRNGRGKYVRLD